MRLPRTVAPLRLSWLFMLLVVAAPSRAQAGGFGIGGFMTELPANFTLRLMFGEMNNPGGWFGLELQPQRLAQVGPLLEPGQQSRAFGLRAGAFLLGEESFAVGIGMNVEGLFTGLPASLGRDPHGLWHGFAGGEIVVGLMPGGQKAPFLAMLFVGSGLAPDDQSRTYGELQLIVPIPMGPILLGVSAGINVSSFKLAGVDLVTVTPAIGILPVPM